MSSSLPKQFTETWKSLPHNILDRSQAGYVLWGAALFDKGLEDELLLKMKPLKKAMRQRIFESYGPLANFAAKIDLCLALDAISEKTYSNLRALNKIRVMFAHSPGPTRLQDEKVAEQLASIVGPIPDGADVASLFTTALRNISNDIERHNKRVISNEPSSPC